MKHCFKSLIAILLITTACSKQDNRTQETNTHNKIAPDGFNFSTYKKVDINIRLLSNQDEPIKRTLVNINSDSSNETLLRGLTDEDGYFKSTINIPSYMETLVVNPQNPGLAHNIQGLIVNNSLEIAIGGKAGLSGNAIKSVAEKGKGLSNIGSKIFATNYPYMGTLDNYGRPLNYREAEKGKVSANLLSYLAAALPDGQNIMTHHPQYVADNATEHLNIVQLSDVWITFVAEGAGNMNSIGYYIYNTANPPSKVSEITEVKLLFPNASGIGSGGTMETGDKVHIGRFSEGTSIGFVLFSAGWNQTLKSVTIDHQKFYSDSKFNPESTSAFQTHTVLLNYAQENQYIIGFEDVNRNNPACDQDFNDVILYATSNPVTGISTTGVNTMGPAADTDGDGIYDNNDEFPTDPTKAYTSYFPTKNTWGTLAFEDNWPAKGDYDMNDVVVKYNYSYINNSNNKVVEMTGSYVLEDAMADYINGFGVQFPFAPSLINSVTGQRLADNFINLNSNSTEAGQTNAVIIPFDNHKTILANNAALGSAKDTVKVNISFTSPISISNTVGAPYNPFLISNKNRGNEIHLSGHLPTNKANLGLFGTQHDDSNPATNKYYLSAQNWPWAISFIETFNYPKEGAAINEAYLHFADWASSGGSIFTDWYKNTASGYRDLSKIY